MNRDEAEKAYNEAVALALKAYREAIARTDDEEGLRPIMLCKLCRAGVGGECHMPGCGLYNNRAPDIPIVGTRLYAKRRANHEDMP